MRILFLLLISIYSFGQDFAYIAKQAAHDTDLQLGLVAPVDYTITPKEWNIDGVKYKPGDRLILQGNRAEIQFTNLLGTADNPIIITATTNVVIKGVNAGGRVVQFINCQHIRFTGGDGNLIEITGGTQAVDFRELTTDCEADHLYIHDVGYLGIGMKTDPTCDPKTWRGAFVLNRPRIHHNRFVNIRTGEAIYVGESHYAGTFPLKNCPTGATSAKEHDVVGVEIYENTFENIGRDAIQVGAATGGGFIRFNYVKNAGMTKEYGQASGIQANPGSSLLIENNIVDGCTSFGVILQGRMGTVVRRNVIKNTAGGIMTVARENDPGSFLVENNDFINVSGNAVEHYSNTTLSNNLFQVSGTRVKRYGGTLTEVNNQWFGTTTDLKLDASYIPMLESPVLPGVGWKDYIAPKPVVTKEEATVELITTDGIQEWYLTTPSGKRKKIE